MALPQQRILDWSILSVQLNRCYEGPVPAKGIGQLSDAGFAAWLVLRGWGCITDPARGGSATARAGQWMFVAPGARLQEFSRGARLLSVNFTAKYETGGALLDSGSEVAVSIRNSSALEEAARQLLEVACAGSPGEITSFTTVDLPRFLRIQRRLFAWIEAWMEALSQKGYTVLSPLNYDVRVVQAIKILEIHLEDGHLTSERVAAQVGISVSHLNRLFLRDTGLTLNEFRARQRMERACRMLVHSRMTMKEIAFDLGFSQPSHFTSWFSKSRGQAPSTFRQQNASPG